MQNLALLKIIPPFYYCFALNILQSYCQIAVCGFKKYEEPSMDGIGNAKRGKGFLKTL